MSARHASGFALRFPRIKRIRWDKRPPAPRLPAEVVARTREKYLEAYERITGRSLDLAAAGAVGATSGGDAR